MVKITTVRGQWISAVLATLAIPLASFLVVISGGITRGETSTGAAATGSLAGLLAFGVWSATISAGEYAQGTIVLSLATVPRRLQFFSAKLMAAACAAALGALVSISAGLLIVVGVRVPGRYGLGDPACLLSVVAAVVAVVVIGVSVGTMGRSPSAAIAVMVVGLLLPKAAGALLGGTEPWIVGASPATVVTQIVGGAQLPASQTYPAGTWAAALTMVVVATAVACGAVVVLLRRDG